MRHSAGFRTSFLLPRYWPTWGLLGLAWILHLMPLRVVGVIADGAAAVIARMPSRRRDIALTNLALCFPGWSPAEVDRVLRANVRISCHLYLGYGALMFGNVERLRQRVRLENLEVCAAAARAGHNVILMCPHWLAYEFVGQCIVAEHPTATMVRLHTNPLLDWIVTRYRTRYGAIVVGHRGARLVGLVRAVRSGAWLYYLPDEDAGNDAHVFAPFFGVIKATTPALGRLARSCRAWIVPLSIRYDPERMLFQATCHEPLDGFPHATVEQDAVRMNESLEAMIRADPAQYAWTAKLFRTGEAGGPKRYPRRQRRVAAR